MRECSIRRVNRTLQSKLGFMRRRLWISDGAWKSYYLDWQLQIIPLEKGFISCMAMFGLFSLFGSQRQILRSIKPAFVKDEGR